MDERKGGSGAMGGIRGEGGWGEYLFMEKICQRKIEGHTSGGGRRVGEKGNCDFREKKGLMGHFEGTLPRSLYEGNMNRGE